jgi:hypothetical protein
MTEPRLHRLLGTTDRDPGCDAGLDVIDAYCDAVHRGEPVSGRFTEFLNHLANCTACREDTEGLLAALRAMEKTTEG